MKPLTSAKTLAAVCVFAIFSGGIYKVELIIKLIQHEPLLWTFGLVFIIAVLCIVAGFLMHRVKPQ